MNNKLNFSPCVCGEGAWQPFMHNLFNYLTVSLPPCNRIFLSIHTLDFLRIVFNAYIGWHHTMDSRLWVKSFKYLVLSPFLLENLLKTWYSIMKNTHNGVQYNVKCITECTCNIKKQYIYYVTEYVHKYIYKYRIYMYNLYKA